MDGSTIVIWLVIIFIISKRYLRSRSLPPGPIGFPIFGNLVNLALTCYHQKLQPYEVFCQWATRYGKVFSFSLGNKLVVVVNDLASAKEAFMSEDITDRPVNTLFDKTTGGQGVVLASSHTWRDQRKFSLGVFRRLGIGKTSFEKLISTEVQHVALAFRAKKNAPFFPSDFFEKATSNVICSVVLGQRFAYSHTEFNDVLSRLNRNFRILDTGGAVLFLPILQYLPYLSNLFDEYASNLKKNFDFVAAIVEEHKANFDRDNPIDFVDECLVEIADRKDDGRDASALAENNLLVTILNLFGAGTETTSTSLSWFLLHMIAYPQVQEKIQQELDSVVGRDDLPQVSHKPDLPYTVAVTLEVMRLQTVAPLAVPHSASKHTYIQGHRVPKDTIVLSNLWHILHDPDVWDNPYQFKPERFLDADGRLNDNTANNVFFGIGRRVCLGENIAKMELFLFITQLMHQFTFQKVEHSPPLIFKGRGGLTNGPHHFQLIAISRDSIAL